MNMMTYDPKQQHRRSIRAKRYDYATLGAYFVTVCTYQRRSLLGAIRSGIVGLSEIGCMVQKVWNELPSNYEGVETDAFVVMPNHIHGIVVLVGAGPRACPKPSVRVGADSHVRPDLAAHVGADSHVRPESTAGEGQARGPAPTVPMVVQRFKSFTTHLHGGTLWQRNYFEHIVRGDRDLDHIREYIATNPVRWTLDSENPERQGDDEFDRWIRSFNSSVGAGSRARPMNNAP
jgi:REP element-mobilizing transposase RayT